MCFHKTALCLEKKLEGGGDIRYLRTGCTEILLDKYPLGLKLLYIYISERVIFIVCPECRRVLNMFIGENTYVLVRRVGAGLRFRVISATSY